MIGPRFPTGEKTLQKLATQIHSGLLACLPLLFSYLPPDILALCKHPACSSLLFAAAAVPTSDPEPRRDRQRADARREPQPDPDARLPLPPGQSAQPAQTALLASRLQAGRAAALSGPGGELAAPCAGGGPRGAGAERYAPPPPPLQPP